MSIICESKYRANGFALISSYLGKGDVDLLLLKEKNSNAYICFNVKNIKALKMLGVKMKWDAWNTDVKENLLLKTH